MIFTYAPAGLGHLRVTDALMDAMPADSQYILLGTVDPFLTQVHRFTSINPVGKYIFLKSQYGLAEEIFTRLYRKFLIWTSKPVYEEVKKIIESNPSKDEVWIIATHFGMAHQIGAVKDTLARSTGRKVRLIVQVTDDTYQHIWCVRGADLTFVPSDYVRKRLLLYAKSQKIKFECEVAPYPLSSNLIETLPKNLGDRHRAFTSETEKIRVAIPISGAAVGLGYITKLVHELKKKSKRFEFWILLKKSPFTEVFQMSLSRTDGVVLVVGESDTEMVALYEHFYKKHLIHLEITKPSEQSFKAIIGPDRVGGSILMFTSPVGRQESENLEFLERHGLLTMEGTVAYPRGIRLSENPVEAAKFIIWSLDSGLFARMTARNFSFSKNTLKSGEVGGEGARIFWKKIIKKFAK